ncbi:hypothetical protein FHG87_007003 [Trinorchestia longiramus]|nr:hypothetical protein FHG87_007003 [Trinorchestia longiramus]
MLRDALRTCKKRIQDTEAASCALNNRLYRYCDWFCSVWATTFYIQLVHHISATCAQKDCTRCDLGAGRCLRCLYAIVEPTRRCTDLCPVGHVPTWRDDYDFQGTVCSPRSLLAAVTGRDIAVIACAAAGGAVCVGIILGAIIYARRNTALKPTPEQSSRIPVPRLWKDPRPSAADVSVSAEERKEFLHSLSGLRKDAPLLLEMLAETRARFRGLSGPENSMDTKARAYRAVVRDLSRVVSLVARGDDSFHSVPSDWRRLFEWADRVLTRYKRTRESKCTGCQHHGTCELKLEEIPSKADSAAQNGFTGGSTQPLFLTRQQAQEARWRQQRQEAAKLAVDPQAKLYWSEADFASTSNNRSRRFGDEIEVTSDAVDINLEDQVALTVTGREDDDETSKELSIVQQSSVDFNDIEISYSKDEEALAHQKAVFSLVDENLKQDLKTNNTNFDAGENKGKKERGSPGVISRIFCNRLIYNSEIPFPTNNDDLQKQKPLNDHNISKEIECLSSNSIYDHIEAFTFEDFSVSQNVETKITNAKSKQKNTANVNVHRLRKPNFPTYSESFKQILDKKNLLNIQKNKIQKQLSKKGEQLNKIVRRTENRFLKDCNKMNPNMTYDRRNCKNDVVNKAVVGGDVYVSIVKQPVVERCKIEECDTYKNFEDMEESNEMAEKVNAQPPKSGFTDINMEDEKRLTTSLKCEILTMV